MEIEDNLSGYSIGLFSSWFYYKPDRLLLDAGEGHSLRMGRRIFAIEKIFLSHGHEDHISGIPSLVNLRNILSGDNNKPLEIYYPAGDPYIEYLKGYLARKQKRFLRYELTWNPLESGDSVFFQESGKKRRMKAFRTRHTSYLTLGYNLVEDRQGVRREFESLSPREIGELIRKNGKDEILYPFEQKTFTYSGDCIGLEKDDFEGTDLLLHEASYLKEDNEERNRHSSIEDVLLGAREGGVKSLVLFHVSIRYPKKEILRKIREEKNRIRLEIPVYVFWKNQLINAETGEGVYP